MGETESKILQKTDVDKLPSLPHILLDLLEVCHDETMSYEQLADIIARDPALYIKVHSVYQRNASQAVVNEPLDQVLQNLSLNTIKNIAVTSAAQQFFSRSSHERTEFLRRHWCDAMLCALVAESIARLSHYRYPEEAYSAGLLHDIGQLVLETAYPSQYSSDLAQVSENDHFHDLETEAFGTTHYQIGAELVRKHSNNPFLADAILYHHEPVDSIRDAHPLVKITCLANLLCDPYFDQDEAVFSAGEKLFGLSRQLLGEILEKAKKELDQAAQHFEIDPVVDGIDGETAKQIVAREQYKQVQLAEQIRNIAMLDGIHQHLSRIDDDAAALVNAIEQHIGILFGVDHSVLFLYQDSRNTLQAVAGDKGPSHVDELAIPLEDGRSLVAQALIERQPVHSFTEGEQLSIIDRQLLGLTRSDGLLCIPMIANNIAVGTIVLGVDKTRQGLLLKQHSLLSRFANEIAHTLYATLSGVSRDATAGSGQERMLQALVSEVAHEVRNPLSIMNNYLEILSFKLDAEDPAQNDIQTIKSEIARVGSILERLNEPSPKPDQIAPVNINQLITELTRVFESSLFTSRDISVKLELDPHIEPIASNANAIKQIYTNLVKNAVEAMPTKGKLMVYTQDSVNVDGQAYIEITVSDNGPGVSPELLPNLFAPVETTKGGEHAGLGLAIVKNLVNELHGSISCRSNNKGTSFQILLPKKNIKNERIPVFAQDKNNKGANRPLN